LIFEKRKIFFVLAISNSNSIVYVDPHRKEIRLINPLLKGKQNDNEMTYYIKRLLEMN